VETAQDEILYPNHYNCPAFRLITKYAEQQYMNTPQFSELIKQVQAHTGSIALTV
jgi:hypothetical protein